MYTDGQEVQHGCHL